MRPSPILPFQGIERFTLAGVGTSAYQVMAIGDGVGLVERWLAMVTIASLWRIPDILRSNVGQQLEG